MAQQGGETAHAKVWRLQHPWYIEGSHTLVLKAEIPKGWNVGWAGS